MSALACSRYPARVSAAYQAPRARVSPLRALTFTSGAFVRTASMPGWLQAFSRANPVTLLADATRGLMVGGPVAVPAVESLLYAAGFVTVFAPLAVRAFRRRE